MVDIHRSMIYNHMQGGETMKTKKDLCEIFRVSLGTVNNWIKQGKIKAVKIGHSVRFSDEEVERLKRSE